MHAILNAPTGSTRLTRSTKLTNEEMNSSLLHFQNSRTRT